MDRIRQLVVVLKGMSLGTVVSLRDTPSTYINIFLRSIKATVLGRLILLHSLLTEFKAFAYVQALASEITHRLLTSKPRLSGIFCASETPPSNYLIWAQKMEMRFSFTITEKQVITK